MDVRNRVNKDAVALCLSHFYSPSFGDILRKHRTDRAFRLPEMPYPPVMESKRRVDTRCPRVLCSKAA